MQSRSVYNEMKKDNISFSLLLDLANQYLKGKEDDLNETDERESHAESEHSSDVGDERHGRHHLRQRKWQKDIVYLKPHPSQT